MIVAALLMCDVRMAQSRRVDVGDVEAASLAAALDQRHDFHLVVPATANRSLGLVVPPIGFVHFDGGAAATKHSNAAVIHRFADAVRHEPRGFVSHAKDALKLLAAHALLGG